MRIKSLFRKTVCFPILSSFLLTLISIGANFKENATHDDSISYCLPYSKHNTILLSQAENGKTHIDDHRFAYDFVMPVGSPVHASRDGVIRVIVDTFRDKAQTEEYKSQGNYILIEHSDGSLAIYAHLDRKGNSVEKSQKVKVGQLIAYSGNTGFTSGPHLHFEVFTFKNRKSVSLPVKFNIGDIVSVRLEAMKTYKAPSSCSNF